jgi:septal ring factor EnvC (AmiA/AmiB activator)
MATLSLEEAEISTAADDFSALEQRVVRAVELVKSERTARAEAEQNAAQLQNQIDAQAALLQQTQEQVRNLEREREQVRQRVERLLKQLDEITS